MVDIVEVVEDKSGELGTSGRSGNSEIQVLFGAFPTHENWVSMKLKVEKPPQRLKKFPDFSRKWICLARRPGSKLQYFACVLLPKFPSVLPVTRAVRSLLMYCL